MNTKKLSFDGKGINDKRNEYAPRVATFASEEYAKEFGPAFENMPELLESLRTALDNSRRARDSKGRCTRVEFRLADVQLFEALLNQSKGAQK